MNSFERFAAAIRFQQTDRIPVVAQVFGHAARLAGAPVDEYVRDGEMLARCQLDALRHYGYDAVFAVMDVSVETEAAGSVLQYRTNQYPIIEEYALDARKAVEDRTVPDPHRAGRMPEMLKALGILRRELRDNVVVVGCIVGPLTLTGQLLGLETALYLAIDAPDQFEHVMDFATDVLARFGRAQLEAGAHLSVVFDPCASPAVIPPNFFRAFELPRLKRLFTALARAGAVANWLHIAGPAGPILGYYPEAGVHLANFDYAVGPTEAGLNLPRTCLNGNIKPLTFVNGNPAEIEAESKALLRAFCGRGGFVLSSGCEIPLESAPENVAAMVDVVRNVQ